MRTLLIALALWAPLLGFAQYNPLHIPDTLAGPAFQLTMRDTFTQLLPGQQTITAGINGNFWGPTLIFNKWDTVYMNVHNQLNDSSTLHWHGFHLPAVMDGGPHQVIPPGTVWQPYWRVTNNAGTYWCHPHLHEHTAEQVIMGLGSLIIVRDSAEAALALPRTYGVDDIPLVISDREFNAANQFIVSPYGDTVLVNGTLNPAASVPAQWVRFRILNASPERSYNLGFSDNRTFYVIGTDGGLLTAPVGVTRHLISVSERIEILVDFAGQEGQTVDLRAFNSTLGQNTPGGDIVPAEPIANALARRDFNIVRFEVAAPTAQPITSLPSSLVSVGTLNPASASLTRTVRLRDTVIGPPGAPPTFILDNGLFDMGVINHSVGVGSVEIWELRSTSTFSHPFHIHDVQFNVLTVNGATPPAVQQGWKDAILVPNGSVIRFIAKFSDYADSVHPYMYHCHILPHEDGGMMGQFTVTGAPTSQREALPPLSVRVHPNPARTRLAIEMPSTSHGIYYVRILNTAGRAIRMLPSPDLSSGLDVSTLPAGVYMLEVTEAQTFRTHTTRFVVE